MRSAGLELSHILHWTRCRRLIVLRRRLLLLLIVCRLLLLVLRLELLLRLEVGWWCRLLDSDA